MKVAVTAFIFHNNKLLTVYHKKLKRWMHVGGHVEKDEFFDEALKREIKEEVNLDVEVVDTDKLILKNTSQIISMKKPFFIHGKNVGYGRLTCIDYVCIAKEPVKIKLLESELEDYKWITKEEIDDLETSPLLKELAHKAFGVYEGKESSN